jgi:hypothetical protein
LLADPLERVEGLSQTPHPDAVFVGSDPTGSTVHAGDGGPLATEKRRLVVTGLTVGVVALFIGWALGRAGGSGPESAATREEPPSSTTPASTVAPEDLGVTVPPVDPDLLPTTTAEAPVVRPLPPPPTTPEGWVLSPGEGRVAVPAAEMAIQIVGVQPSGRVIELDTATGDLATTELDMGVGMPSGIYAGPDWILVTSPDSTGGRLLRGREEPETISVGQMWLFHHQPGTDRFWRIREPMTYGERFVISEVMFDGSETGVRFESDGRFWSNGADAVPGLVVSGAPGGSYHVGPDGSHRITTGYVLAVGPTVALATECGESIDTCGLVVVDRTTGTSTPLTPVFPEGEEESPERLMFESAANYGYPGLLAAISPDGRYSPILINGRDQDFGVIDLVTGEFIQFGDTPQSSLWWSPDSRSAMYLVNGHLTVYDLETRTTYEVSQDVFPLNAFAVRPAVT